VSITNYIKLDSQFEVCAHRNPHTRAVYKLTAISETFRVDTHSSRSTLL